MDLRVIYVYDDEGMHDIDLSPDTVVTSCETVLGVARLAHWLVATSVTV